MNIVQFEPKKPDKASALASLDDLRAKIESGELAAFAAVGIAPDDELLMWTGSTGGISRLRVIGAIARLQTCYTLDPQ